MYCKFCGKQIAEDAEFCQFCGGNLNGVKRTLVNVNENLLFSKIQKITNDHNLNKLLILLTAAFFALSSVVRFTMQRIESILYGLAYDDYYVVTNTGRIWIVIFIIIQVVLFLLFRFWGIKNEKPLKKSAYIFSAVALVIEIFLLFVKFPAPY